MRRLVAESVRLAWQAGRRELIVMAAMQALTIVLVVAEVLVGRSLVSGLLHAEIANEHVGTLIPEVLGLAGLTAALGIANAIQLNRQRILTELTTRLGEERVLAVTSAVDLAAFDEPGFHDRVERAGQAVLRLPAVVTSLSGMLRALSGAVGAAIGLVALQPLFAVEVGHTRSHPARQAGGPPKAFTCRLRLGTAWYGRDTDCPAWARSNDPS
jgi:hypothetical protein